MFKWRGGPWESRPRVQMEGGAAGCGSQGLGFMWWGLGFKWRGGQFCARLRQKPMATLQVEGLVGRGGEEGCEVCGGGAQGEA